MMEIRNPDGYRKSWGFNMTDSFEADLAPLIHEVRVCHASKMTKVIRKMEDIHA